MSIEHPEDYHYAPGCGHGHIGGCPHCETEAFDTAHGIGAPTMEQCARKARQAGADSAPDGRHSAVCWSDSGPV